MHANTKAIEKCHPGLDRDPWWSARSPLAHRVGGNAAHGRAAAEVVAGHRWCAWMADAKSCAWAGCGANQAQALAAGDPATERGYESAARGSSRALRLMLAKTV